MEKVVAALWARADESHEVFGARLLAGLPAALEKAGARKVRLNIRDAAMNDANAPRLTAVSEQTGTWQQWQSPSKRRPCKRIDCIPTSQFDFAI